MSIAVFVNPHSRSCRRDPTIPTRFAEILGDAGRVIAPQTLDALADEARAVAAAPPQVIAVHGGDGTLHQTLGAILRKFGSAPIPPVAILAGGTMNVVATSLGIRARPERLLEGLAETVRAGGTPTTVPRRCLQVGDSYGFVFGNGLMANFLEEYYARGGYGPSRAVWILGRTFLSGLAAGNYARRIFRRFRGKVFVDGALLPYSALTGVGAATVREVGLGFKLNHRADEDLERFSVLAIHADALTLALDIPAVHQGRGVDPARAYSTLGTELVIEPEDEDTVYTIDGDLYRARGRLTVKIGPKLSFVAPPPPGLLDKARELF